MIKGSTFWDNGQGHESAGTGWITPIALEFRPTLTQAPPGGDWHTFQGPDGTFLSHRSPLSSTPVSLSKAFRSGSQSSQLLGDSLTVTMGKAALRTSRGQRRTVQRGKSADGLILKNLGQTHLRWSELVKNKNTGESVLCSPKKSPSAGTSACSSSSHCSGAQANTWPRRCQ